jgi:5-phospho-D-xylono-1,4-lactonase
MPANAGRNIIKLAAVSQQTGVHIIAPTGVHLPQYYVPNHWQHHYTEDELTELFIADVQAGIDIYDYSGPIVKRSVHKAGMVKLATGDAPINAHLEKIFRAVVNTHLETGVPILTHSNFGLHALAQAQLFAKLGAKLEHIVISHVDRNKDIAYHKALLDTGINVEYDSAFRWKPTEENYTYTLLKALLERYPTQITMGMDAARNTYWKSYGGQPGLNFLLTTFKTDLEKMGLQNYYQHIFFNNPQKLYTFWK